MSGNQLMPLAHPLGEQSEREAAGPSVVLDTFAGRVHVEWEPAAPLTALGQLPFLLNFSSLFDNWLAACPLHACPLHYTSPNAPKKRDVLGTMVLSILAGQWRYAHITAVRGDGVNPGLLGMERVGSEDACLDAGDRRGGLAAPPSRRDDPAIAGGSVDSGRGCHGQAAVRPPGRSGGRL